MWRNLKYFLPGLSLVALAVIFSTILAGLPRPTSAATVLITNSSDTLSTFRTNVNASLLNLASDRLGTTSAWTVGQILYATGATTTATVATSSIAGSGAISVTGSGYVVGSPVTVSCATCATFSYLFPSNATSTSIAFNGGLTASSLSIGSLSGLVAANSGSTYAAATGTVSAGSGISVSAGQSVIGSGLTITNTGVTSLAASAGIALSGSTGAVTVTNTIGYPFPSNATSSALTLTGLLTISNSSTTAGSFSYASSSVWRGGGLTSDCDTAASSKLLWDITTGQFSCGSDQSGAGSTYPFLLAGNATSTLTQFNGGLTAFGSSTIGAGGTTTGLTISGGATTTGRAVGTDTTNNWTGVVSPTRRFSLGSATTTTWTGTTTGAYVPILPMDFAGTLRTTVCTASSSQAFLGVTVYINQTKVSPTYFVSSSTEGTVSFTSNNTFSKGDVISAYFGTSTTDTNALGSICTFDVTES